MTVHVWFWALLCLAIASSVVAVDSDGQSRELTIADIPPCGTTCLFLRLPESGCDLSDSGCQCKNHQLGKAVAACMLANCTMTDAVAFAQVEKELCDLSEHSRSTELLIFTGSSYVVVVVCVALRLVAKVSTKKAKLDDWVIVSAVLLSAISIGCVLKMSMNGLGQHMWNISSQLLLKDLRLYYVAYSTYVVVLALVKIAILLLWIDLFGSPRLQTLAYLVMSWIGVNTLIIVFISIFNCWPIYFFWDKELKGTFMDINAVSLANVGSTIAQDWVILLFPLACFRKLNMKRFRKIGIGLMFTFGVGGCAATIMQLLSLLESKATIDPTWDYIPVAIWTEVETTCGFICVTLPAIRIFFTLILPKSFLNLFVSPPDDEDKLKRQGAENSTKSTRATTEKTTSLSAQMPSVNFASRLSTTLEADTFVQRGLKRASSNTNEPVQIPAIYVRPPRTNARGRHRGLMADGGPARVNLSHIRTYTPPAPPKVQKQHENPVTKHVSLSHVRTCTPSVPASMEDEITRLDTDLELGTVPKIRQGHVCLSCGSEGGYMTALPSSESHNRDITSEAGAADHDKKNWRRL